jgi:multiple sugar transport system ATP-binding protein
MTLGDRVAVLDAGVLQQADRPRTLWDRPANAFVAGFLGSPPMNLLPGTLDERGRLRSGDNVLALPSMIIANGSPRRGQPLLLGIRPENVRLVSDRMNSDLLQTSHTLTMDVVLVETTGRGRQVMLQRDGWLLTALLDRDGDDVQAGQTTQVAVDMRRAHLFDGTSGNALCHPP